MANQNVKMSSTRRTSQTGMNTPSSSGQQAEVAWTSSFESIVNQPVHNRPTLELAIAKMVEAKNQDRRDRKTEMYLKTSRLWYTALIEDVICSTERNFTKEDLAGKHVS